MRRYQSLFLAWQRAEHEAREAERDVYEKYRDLDDLSVPAPADVARSHALRAHATELLKAFLEDSRQLAASLKER